MESSSIWLFLFIALIIGWSLGHLESKKSRRKSAPKLDSNQVKSRLQLLFDSYSDSAIDRMLQNLEVTPETFSTHVSIGKHFRKQGEVEKAILVHQNLMAHPELSQKNSDTVIMELAKDYRAAGLFDRAVALLEQLMSSKEYLFEANRLMLDIREKERDWSSAVEHAEKVDLKRYPEIRIKLSHYFCELAEEKLSESLVRESELLYKQALQSSKQCVRAVMGLAKINICREEYGVAIRLLKQVPEISPEDTSLVFPLMLECTIATHSFNQYRDYLDFIFEKTGQVSAIVAYVESLKVDQGVEEACEYLKQRVKAAPSIQLLEHLFTLISENNSDAISTLDFNDMAPEIQLVLKKVASEKAAFKCNHCGFDSSQLIWQCPSCKNWQTLKPALVYIKD